MFIDLHLILINHSRLMRSQQNEYNRALAIDRQKAQERKQKEQQKLEEEKRAKEEMERMMAKINRIKQKKDEIAKNIANHQEPEITENDLVRIRVSFPNGIKMEKRFWKADSLEVFTSHFILNTNNK
jgi:seryl-tRNA synthetase